MGASLPTMMRGWDQFWSSRTTTIPSEYKPLLDVYEELHTLEGVTIPPRAESTSTTKNGRRGGQVL